ncbi:YheT family hydrolase [Alcanivorax sp. IL3]|uniref:YheT family hydrolase n=1 Tax=unclassified Alcanivorax TaxID=2638842 RepID=UPI0032D906C0
MTLFIVVLLASLAVAYYLKTAARKPQLVYRDTGFNRNMLARLPQLSQRFFPTPWLFNTHLQLIVLGLKKAFSPALDYSHTDILTMRDGGTTSLDWVGLDTPTDTPTLLVLHTITGSPKSMRELVRDLHQQTGWRVVVCTRRGHGDLPLTAPRINTMGDTDDLREQIAVIQQRYPQSPLYAVGISAGSGLLVRYLGEEGESAPFRGAMAYCPGYNIEVAFRRARQPYNRMMARKLARTFVTANAEAFRKLQSYDACASAPDLHAFHANLHEMAGYHSHADFLEASNPMMVMKRISIPLLVLNAEDDPVCVIGNVREYESLVRELPRTLLVITRRGSHCAYFEGLRPRSWANRLIANFLLNLEKNPGLNP